MKKSLLLLPLIAALSAASLPVRAADYHIVVPAPGKTAPYAAIKLELNAASLPVGWIGDPFVGFDFNTALRITGDPDLDMSQVVWSVYSGSLLNGLSLAKDGRLVGTPTEPGSTSLQVLAKYKTKSALASYSIETKAERHLANNSGVRRWEDSAIAQSCLEYRQPTYPYVYAGDTGDGLYRIAPNGQAPVDVYCDMTSEGGGWTRVVRQTEAQPVANWDGGMNGASYTLSSVQIPAHTQTAFGKDDQATFIDYVNWSYTTQNIHPAVTVNSPKTGLSYQIHRNTTSYHHHHDPAEVAAIPPGLSNGLPTSLDWLNTLTFNRMGGRYTWAFGPLHSNEGSRGHSIGGEVRSTSDNFAWTVWVR